MKFWTEDTESFLIECYKGWARDAKATSDPPEIQGRVD